MTLESKVVKELRKIGSGLKDSAFRFLVRHPVLAGAGAALIGANAYYQNHKVDPNIIRALAEDHIDPLTYRLPGYLTYLGLGLIRDYGPSPRQQYQLGSPHESSLKRWYHRVVNHPRLNGLITGILAGVAQSSERVLARGENMDTGDFLRGLVQTSVGYALAAEVILRTFRNATLLRQGRRGYARHQGLVERILSAPFDHPIAFGAATTVALGPYFVEKGGINNSYAINAGGLGLHWLLATNAYMFVGAFLHPMTIKKVYHLVLAGVTSITGKYRSSVRRLEKVVQLPSTRENMFKSLSLLGQEHQWNNDVEKAKETYRRAIATLRSDETNCSYFDLMVGPLKATFTEEYEKLAHSTNPVLTLHSFGNRMFVLKLDRNDYEYRINLLLEKTFDYAHPEYILYRRLPFSIMCKPGADGRFEHFMLRSNNKPIGERIRKASERRRIGGSVDLLGRLSQLHALVTRKLAEHDGKVPLPDSDTEKSIEVPPLDYGSELMHRAISGEGRGTGYRLCKHYRPGESQALDDVVGTFNDRVVPQMNALPRVFLHHDISPTNVLGKKHRYSIIDFGLSRIGNPLIDVDHTLDMFGISIPDAVDFIEFYAKEYNEQSGSHVKPDDLSAGYIPIASHNALCSLGTSLQREDYKSARRLLSRARECFSYSNLKEMRGPFEAVVKNDERLKALS